MIKKLTKKTKKGDCCGTMQHPDHSALLPNLNRIGGQVEGVKKMITERRYCPDILIQLRALRSAINSIEANILETHLGACVKDAFNSNDEKEITEKIAELKDLYKRFND
jgi:DNA-binding FrmR family transcriptional regulator